MHFDLNYHFLFYMSMKCHSLYRFQKMLHHVKKCSLRLLPIKIATNQIPHFTALIVHHFHKMSLMPASEHSHNFKLPHTSQPLYYTFAQILKNSVSLTLKAWSKICSRRHSKTFVLFFRENKSWHFMWIICLADDSHEMLTCFLWKIKKKKKKWKKNCPLLQLWLVLYFKG